MSRAARIPDDWVIDWRDVARLALEDLEREDPPLVKRVTEPDGDLVRFEGRPWPASARRFELTDAGERELARLRGDTEDAWDDDENVND